MERLCARSGPSRTRLENGRCEPVGVDALEALDNVVFIGEEDSEHERPLLARGRIRVLAGIIGCLTLGTPAVPAPTEPGGACWARSCRRRRRPHDGKTGSGMKRKENGGTKKKLATTTGPSATM